MSSPKPVAENGFERAELSLRFRRLTELQDLNSAHCPFCGELAEVRESYHCASGKPAALPAFVGCRGCGYVLGPHETTDAAIAHFTTRTGAGVNDSARKSPSMSSDEWTICKTRTQTGEACWKMSLSFNLNHSDLYQDAVTRILKRMGYSSVKPPEIFETPDLSEGVSPCFRLSRITFEASAPCYSVSMDPSADVVHRDFDTGEITVSGPASWLATATGVVDESTGEFITRNVRFDVRGVCGLVRLAAAIEADSLMVVTVAKRKSIKPPDDGGISGFATFTFSDEDLP